MSLMANIDKHWNSQPLPFLILVGDGLAPFHSYWYCRCHRSFCDSHSVSTPMLISAVFINTPFLELQLLPDLGLTMIPRVAQDRWILEVLSVWPSKASERQYERSPILRVPKYIRVRRPLCFSVFIIFSLLYFFLSRTKGPFMVIKSRDGENIGLFWCPYFLLFPFFFLRFLRCYPLSPTLL